MQSKDLISKQLIKRLLVDFGNQLFGLNIAEAELLSSEQPRIEGKRADLVARVKNKQGENYILHVEIQNDNRANMPLRMLRYYTDLALAYVGEDIRQYLLYIGKAPLTMSDRISAYKWFYRYGMLDVRTLDCELFLKSNNPDAVVLAILCDPKGQEPRDLVVRIASELRRLHQSRLNELRESFMMLDILASNRDLQDLVKENSEMFIEVEKLGLYQAAVEKGVEQGVEQGQQEVIINLLHKFTVEQTAELSGVPLARVSAIAAGRKTLQ